jgi:peptidyl-prolyl cis-trans isomerase SurA
MRRFAFCRAVVETGAMRRPGIKLALAACALAAALGCEGRARAVIVERVVAVVGERPILLTELQRRAHTYLYRIIANSQNPAQIAAQKTEMEKVLLDRMIDDRLEEQQADRARLSVSAEEVDSGLRNIAGAAHINVEQLIEEARRQGLSEQDYREEVRRQLLEGKLIQLRVRGRVRVTDQDAHAAYQRYLLELDKESPIDLRIIALRIPPGSNVQKVQQITQLANRIVTEARRPNADFCDLVTKYNEDTQTMKTCGSRGPQPRSALVPELQAATDGLKSGEVTEPVPVGTAAILVVQVGADRPPTFDEVKDEMWQRAYGEAIEHQRKLWLDEVKHGVYVDVRL